MFGIAKPFLVAICVLCNQPETSSLPKPDFIILQRNSILRIPLQINSNSQPLPNYSSLYGTIPPNGQQNTPAYKQPDVNVNSNGNRNPSYPNMGGTVNRRPETNQPAYSTPYPNVGQANDLQPAYVSPFASSIQPTRPPQVASPQNQPQPQPAYNNPYPSNVEGNAQQPYATRDEVSNRNPVETAKPSLTNSDFNSNLYHVIAMQNPRNNVIISPYSIANMLAMVNFGAVGETSAQLEYALGLPNNKTISGLIFRNINQMQRNSSDVKLQTANKLFYEQRKGSVRPSFERYASEFFGAEIEDITFEQPQQAVDKINRWAAARTENRIRNLLSYNDLEWDTIAVLVNTVYFKAKWLKPFSTLDTTDDTFHVTQNYQIPTKMMFNDDVFYYAEIPELQAKVLEMPYAKSDLSMVLILPDEIGGLERLQEVLRSSNNLDSILSRLKKTEVKVRIPKFRMEFETDMMAPLGALGVSRIFTENAELPYILRQNNGLRITKIKQKAILEINEAGSEAVAASFANFVPLSLPVNEKTFTADHPFMFMIKSPQTILFIGHYNGINK